MDEDIYVKKIFKLLRIARDQGDRPEGKNAARMAEILQRRRGIRVELTDEDPDERQSAMVATGLKPCAWQEWLAETVSAAYRCKCEPVWLGRHWQLWIHCSDPARLAACRAHFESIANQIVERRNAIARRLHTPGDVAARSYMEGLALRASERLLDDLGWKESVPFSTAPFDAERFHATAKDPHRGPALPPSKSASLVPYVHRMRDVEPSPEPPPDAPDDGDGDPIWFARGRFEGRYLDVAPPRSISGEPTR